MNQKKRIALTTTFVGLVCGFVLTQQQAAAATNAPDPTTTSMLAPENTATATSVKPAEPSQNDQPANKQTSTQKTVANTNTVNETVNQNQTTRIHSIGSSATNTTAQPATSSKNPTTSVQPQQEAAAQNTAATSLDSHVHEATNQMSQPTASAATPTIKDTNNANIASATTDPQVETIAQGTWGTSKWEYTHQGPNYILHFHAGILGASNHKIIEDTSYPYGHHLGSIGASPEIFNDNWQWNDELTQIIIDPGVIANQDSSYLFGYLNNLQKIVGLDNLDTTNVTDMSSMFFDCYSLNSLDLSNFNTAKVTDMSYMFDYCTSLTSLDVSSFNTAKVTDMSYMFSSCENLTSLDLSKFNTDNVINMLEMFCGCYKLTSLDVSNFNTDNVINMSAMFFDCEKLTSLDVSHFNTANVINMSFMFQGCTGLTSLDVSKFNTAHAIYMFGMFEGCRSLTNLDLSNFSTGKDTNVRAMFDDCLNLNHLILGPDTLFNTNAALPRIPKTGTQIPGTAKRVTSPYWVATSGYQQGHKYTSNELMGLTGRDRVTTYDWDSTPAFTQTTETKAVTRAIRIHQPDGYLKTELQTVMVHRPVTINPDGSKTYGAWSTAQWDAYQIPEIAGYQANNSSIAAQSVNGETVDQTIDVYYQPQLQTVEIQYLDQGQIVGKQTITGYTGQTIVPNYQVPEGYEITTATPATITIDGSGKQIIQVNVSHKQEESMEYKTITRTVNLHQTNGQIKTYNQVALLQRSVQIDAVTGNKTYGRWNTGYWDAINIPTVAGYTASQDQVADQLVTDQDTNQTVDVYYTPTH